MTLSFAIKAGLILLFVASILYVHLRGKARLPVLRQFVNHSAFFAPYNALMYLFSAVPSKPYLDRSKFPELDVLKNNWQVIREEAMHLFDEGYIRAAEKNNDAGFGSFFKKGWKRFYLKWYDKALPPTSIANTTAASSTRPPAACWARCLPINSTLLVLGNAGRLLRFHEPLEVPANVAHSQPENLPHRL